MSILITTACRRLAGAMLLLLLASGPQAAAALMAPAGPADGTIPSAHVRRQIEEDWLKGLAAPVSTRSDAAGACDGVKDGRYGFHAGLEPNPWWQVDLGEPTAIGRIVVYNRLDYEPGLHNADQLLILTSDDARTWTVRHENRGRHFGGVRGTPLEVRFPTSPPKARFVRLRIPGDKPIYLHLDEVEVYGPGPTAPNLALHRPADQSSLSPWSTAKLREQRFPTREVIERGRRLAGDLARSNVDVAEHLRGLDAAAARLAGLAPDAGESAQRAVYLEARWAVRRIVFANPLLNFDRLLFVKRFTQETYPDVCLNHMPWVSRPGGDLAILSAPAGTSLASALAEGRALTVRHLLNGALGPGHVHGMDLHWDAGHIVFGYARARTDQPPSGWLDRTQSYRLRRTEEPIHLFEVGIDGRGLRQLTEGEWSDLDPTYLASGDIAFVSERCGTSLQCNEYDKDETSCNLYVMRRDGSGVRRLSSNKDGDYLPHALDDGTIGYTRWEYHERSWAYVQSLWTIRPDGTFADAIFKQHFVDPWALEDVRSIPGSRKLVAIAAGHHTLAVGPVVVIDQAVGINDPAGIRIVTPGVRPPEGGMAGARVAEGGVPDHGGFYSTPWPLSEKHFLVAYTYGPERDPAGYALYLIDVHGNKELICRDPAISCFAPIPLRPRPRPPVLADQAGPARAYATCIVSSAAFGADGIEPKQVRYLRIAEPIGWPYDNQRGGQRFGEDHGYGGPGAERKNLANWTPVRILGTVPVESDGSAHFRVPADTAVYFQLLDAEQMELRRMRSFVSFQPGEVRACAGCHETRAAAPPDGPAPLAARRAPSIPAPPPWGDRPVSFLRDVQPVLDRHCVACHAGLKPAGDVDLAGGLTTYDPKVPGYGHNRAYETILAKGLVSISAVRQQDASVTPALAYGSRRSRLIASLKEGSHVGKVKLGEEDRLRLVTWIDANAPYHDGFVDKRPAAPAYDLAADPQLARGLADAHAKRCASCHEPAALSRTDWIDVREPHKSLFLARALPEPPDAPARRCGGGYAGAEDPDYLKVLALVEEAVRRQWAHPRRDVRSLEPAYQSRSAPRKTGPSVQASR